MPDSTPETIDVRPDEDFDRETLAAYLKDRLPGADAPMNVRQFGGGAANLTYLLDFGGVEYVLRRPPLGPVAASAHDMQREYRVLSKLYKHYPPAPKAFLYCENEDIIGAPFQIMERRRGRVIRTRLPEDWAGSDDAPRRMSRALVDTLADFHAVDYGRAGLADLGRPEGFIERQVDGWYARWNKAKVEDLDAMDQSYEWLMANLPEAGRTSLVHNDFKLDNVMLADDDPGRVVAVLDWDMCTLGDPMSDLGALLTYWCRPDDPETFLAIATMPVDERFPTRKQLVSWYEERAGITVDNPDYYHVLGLFRLAVILAQIYIRYHRGQTRDERFAHFDKLTTLAAEWAASIAS